MSPIAWDATRGTDTDLGVKKRLDWRDTANGGPVEITSVFSFAVAATKHWECLVLPLHPLHPNNANDTFGRVACINIDEPGVEVVKDPTLSIIRFSRCLFLISLFDGTLKSPWQVPDLGKPPQSLVHTTLRHSVCAVPQTLCRVISSACALSAVFFPLLTYRVDTLWSFSTSRLPFSDR